jgi:hypothetical protein
MSSEQIEIESLKAEIDKLAKRITWLEEKESWRVNEADLMRKYPSNRIR